MFFTTVNAQNVTASDELPWRHLKGGLRAAVFCCFPKFTKDENICGVDLFQLNKHWKAPENSAPSEIDWLCLGSSIRDRRKKNLFYTASLQSLSQKRCNRCCIGVIHFLLNAVSGDKEIYFWCSMTFYSLVKLTGRSDRTPKCSCKNRYILVNFRASKLRK